MALSRVDKLTFVNDLVGDVTEKIKDNIRLGLVPDSWDGIELRQYVADTFLAHTTTMHKARLQQFKNDVLIHNL